MRLGDLLHDGEAQAGAAAFAVRRERLKELPLKLSWNPRAVVRHIDDDCVARKTQRHGDAGRRRAFVAQHFAGVLDEIDQCALQLRRIGQDHRVGRGVDHQFGRAGCEQMARLLAQLTAQLRKGDRAAIDLGFAGEVEHVVDDAHRVAAGLAHQWNELTHLGRVVLRDRLVHQVAYALNIADRVAQIVHDGCERTAERREFFGAQHRLLHPGVLQCLAGAGEKQL